MIQFIAVQNIGEGMAGVQKRRLPGMQEQL